MLIKQLLSGRRKSELVIIKDNLQFNGLFLLKKFIQESKLLPARIHLVLTENLNITDVQENCVAIHHYFPDPWKHIKGSETDLSFDQIIDCVYAEIVLNDESAFPQSQQYMLVIDSLSSLLQHMDVYTLIHSLQKLISLSLRTGAVQIVGLLHTDLIPEDSQESKYLIYMATSVISLSHNQNLSAQMSVAYYQSNGSNLKETYHCGMTDKGEVTFELQKEKLEPVKENMEKLVNTTFKLTLEEKEKESRKQIVLPYTKAAKNNSGRGQIYYEPDVNDDWDDEDPDDDLEL